MKSDVNLRNHGFDESMLKNTSSLPKSNSHDNPMMGRAEDCGGNRASCLNSAVSLNPIIEDPSKEDGKSSDSNSRCNKTLGINPFITNEELKTPTTIDYSVMNQPSPIQSKNMELSAEARSREVTLGEEVKESKSSVEGEHKKQQTVKAKGLAIPYSLGTETKTIHLKEKEIKEFNIKKETKSKLQTAYILEKEYNTKLEGGKSCCCFGINSKHLSLIHICRCRRIERCRSRWSPYH
eukprot:TRINITY_DN25944_c0_g1_i1.p1 TRINITY_DN25944_c0_g1~~TRINITY_DN25944_c0_g1_i1.p1  ORF type:complete len:237 (-),score=65.61 TRINITY_DN25944_c0_g1_i1:17-727(-)